MKSRRTPDPLLAALAIVLACLAAPVTAAEEEVEQEIKDKAAAYNDHLTNERNKLVCRKEAITGSRFKKTVCRSVAAMENSEYQARRFLDQKMSGIAGTGGGDASP